MPRKQIGWFSPDPRGVLLPGRFHVSRSLKRSMRKFHFSVNNSFGDVIRACGDPARPNGWIDGQIIRAYTHLHHLGWAQSVETWDSEGLAGGLYGIQIGGLFAAESMFHRRTDASKAALCHLVDRLGERPGQVIDVQWPTDHLKTLGVQTVGRARYAELLAEALALPGSPSLVSASGGDQMSRTRT